MHPEAGQLLRMAADAANRGDFAQALPMLSHALAIDSEATAPAYAELLSHLSLTSWPRQLEADLVTCLNAGAVDPQTLARAAARMLLVKYPEPVVAGDALWEAFLTRCINVDPAMEVRLIWLAGQDLPDGLRDALAVQAFASEYVWGGERLGVPADAMVELAEELVLAVEMPSLESSFPRRRPGPRLESCDAESGPRPSPGKEEEEDAGRRISGAVRAQYETNPYPRWRAPAARQHVSVSAHLAALGAPQEQPLAVLVAGCGTGFEPIDLAGMDKSLAITALDLSAASLAYGKRMAGVLGVERVRFVQGDILDVEALGQRFGLVNCTGVLHHMERPEDGLAALVEVLEPGGVLRLALYSERARAWVAEARRVIGEQGWDANPAGIRAFRAYVFALPPEQPLARLRESDDFYSLSGCRDLCFHVREHWYRLPAVQEMLAGAGLELLMLDAPPEAQHCFTQLFGTAGDRRDLGLWDRVEGTYPHLFAGMFHLWARKPG
ncbi:SAM-dependent methyltransferase [Sphingomonas kyeonggiensis]|uniref:class I SAM-dependent methyltransferase n=1 Tax=Sphingomonas kyeonggiensis TaxID=1268553 RepID=UPI00278A5F55|nr:class I SAM-dependent methyltransferase [Sphingomonas kyeonggiensis]MDQ0249739.1 SAM-dependent methyltransferase [Sphingomonas kyeonggiensis]